MTTDVDLSDIILRHMRILVWFLMWNNQYIYLIKRRITKNYPCFKMQDNIKLSVSLNPRIYLFIIIDINN